MIPWINRAGLQVPRDISYCSLDLSPETHPRVAGMVNQRAIIRRVAVDLLAAQLRSHSLGPPEAPYVVAIKTLWHDGATLRPVPPGAA